MPHLHDSIARLAFWVEIKDTGKITFSRNIYTQKAITSTIYCCSPPLHNTIHDRTHTCYIFHFTVKVEVRFYLLVISV